MKRIVVTLFAALLLSLGAAFAQSNMYVGGGLSIGFPHIGASAGGGSGSVGGTAFGFSGHFGLSNLIAPNLGVRGSLSLGFGSGSGRACYEGYCESTGSGGFTLFRLAADAIYNLNLGGGLPIAPYLGGGLRYGSISAGGRSAGGIGIGFLGGARYPFSGNLSGFGEFSFDVIFANEGTLTYPALTFGVDFAL